MEDNIWGKVIRWKMQDWKMEEQIWGQATRWKMWDRKMEDKKMEDRKLQDQVLEWKCINNVGNKWKKRINAIQQICSY